MKAVSAKVTKALNVGASLICADNSGAKELELVAVKGYSGVKRRQPKCGVGDVIICSVKKGDEKIRKELVEAVVIRQRREYRRGDGMRVKFDDNAAVLMTMKTKEPRGTEIRGPVAREAVQRFTTIGKIASIVI